MTMQISYRDGGPGDAAVVDHLFRTGFCDTFAHLYDPADLAAFLSGITLERWEAELSDPGFAFRIAEVGGEAAGYVKLGPSELPVTLSAPSIELRQLYILKAWHGAGIAQVLMDWALDVARQRGAEDIYLTVFTDNHRARRFYQRYGFSEVGPYTYMVGNHADEDIIMKRAL